MSEHDNARRTWLDVADFYRHETTKAAQDLTARPGVDREALGRYDLMRREARFWSAVARDEFLNQGERTAQIEGMQAALRARRL